MVANSSATSVLVTASSSSTTRSTKLASSSVGTRRRASSRATTANHAEGASGVHGQPPPRSSCNSSWVRMAACSVRDRPASTTTTASPSGQRA